MLPVPLQELVRNLGRRGEAPALIAFRGGESEIWTFAQLGAAIERLSAGFIKRGLGRLEPVAIWASNGPRWIVTCLAVVNAGATIMPIDERASDPEVAHMLKANGCRWLVASGRRAPRLTSHLADESLRVVDIDGSISTDHRFIDWDSMQGDAAAPQPDVDAAEVAAIVHTSGTTGTPKAVPLSHANIMSNVTGLLAEGLIGAGDRALLPLPLHHVYPFTVGFLTPLAAGAAIVLPSGLSGPELVVALRRGAVTHLVGVPRLYTALFAEIQARARSRGRFASRWFSALLGVSGWLSAHLHWPIGRILFRSVHRALAPRLHLLVSGGAALDSDTERVLEALGWEVLSGYGLTETSPILTFNRHGAKRAGSAGRPLGGVSLRVVDASADGIGQIQARGPSVFAGYRNDEAATQAAFTHDGWFRTGDLGFIDGDGYLHISGRLTETIILPDGKKIFPENIEAVYAASPFVKELAVLVHRGALVALVIPNIEAMQAHGTMRARDLIHEGLIACGAMLPAHERFAGFALAAGSLPRTHLGKLRRHLLPALYERALDRREVSAPAEISPEDQALLDSPVAGRLWAWLKARFPDRPLSLDTNPQLDLGVDSLGWVDLTLGIQRSLGITLTEASMARVATVRDLLSTAMAAAALPVPAASATQLPDLSATAAPAGMGLRLVRLVLARANRVVMRRVFHLCVVGADKVPAHGPCLICPNHVSYLDPFVLAAALPDPILLQTWWAGWTGILFAGRLPRAFSRIAQVVPVDPDRAVASSLAWSAAVLDQGHYLVWFPEGIRSADGELQRFLPGVGVLLDGHRVPVVPVHIAGTFAAWPRQRRWPRFRPVRVSFGDPIAATGVRGDGAQRRPDQIADDIRGRVAALGASRSMDT